VLAKKKRIISKEARVQAQIGQYLVGDSWCFTAYYFCSDSNAGQRKLKNLVEGDGDKSDGLVR